jgi:hypothetical protein
MECSHFLDMSERCPNLDMGLSTVDAQSSCRTETLFKRLTPVSAGRFYRFEQIVAYSSGKVVAKSVNPPDPKPSQTGH